MTIVSFPSSFSFTYVGNDTLSHFASRSVLSMASSNIDRSQSNIYLDDPDFYHHDQDVHYFPNHHSISTMNMPLMGASSSLNPPTSSSTLKNAVSMQQLKDSSLKTNNRLPNKTEQQNMIVDQNRSTLSIPHINEQQLINERLMCIQQLIDSGQNFASMFNDDPYFAQQMMTYMSSANQLQQDDHDVIEIMDE